MSFFNIIAAIGNVPNTTDDLMQHSIKNFGALSDGTTDDKDAINQALLDYDTIYFEPNTLTIIGGAISIPSNKRIVIGINSEVKLKNGAADYMFYNSDFVNGNTNITFEGEGITSIVNGNKQGIQSRRLVSPISDKSYYWGMGFLFYNVTNLIVKNFRINETESYGVLHYACNFATFEDIYISQFPQGGNNGDGVSGISSNLTIRNISGYTNDDMVYIGSGGGSIGDVEMGLASIDVENILVENITGEIKSGLKAWRGVRVSGRDNKRLDNVVINNVSGDFEYQAIELANFWPTSNPGLQLGTITMNGISRNPTGTARNTIGIFSCTIDTLILNNVTANPNTPESTINLSSGTNLKITNLEVTNSSVVNESGSDIVSLIYDAANVTNITLDNNIFSSNPYSDLSGYIYRKTSNVNTRIFSTNNQLIQNTIRKGIGLNGGNNLSVVGTDIYVDKSELTPATGDTVLDIDSGVVTYDGLNWN